MRYDNSCQKFARLFRVLNFFTQCNIGHIHTSINCDLFPQKKLFYQHEGEKLAKKIVLTSMIVFKKDSNDKSENIIGG